jgi:hypothetical protein
MRLVGRRPNLYVPASAGFPKSLLWSDFRDVQGGTASALEPGSAKTR